MEREREGAAPAADRLKRHPDRRPRWDNAEFAARVLIEKPPGTNEAVRSEPSPEAPLNVLDADLLAEGLIASAQDSMDLWD